MNYATVPQKILIKTPIYENTCIYCKSSNTYPLMNMIGSNRKCNNCKNLFQPKISGYNSQMIEKYV